MATNNPTGPLLAGAVRWVSERKRRRRRKECKEKGDEKKVGKKRGTRERKSVPKYCPATKAAVIPYNTEYH
jgi:hypothetical protein